jgi:hypothetical protein
MKKLSALAYLALFLIVATALWYFGHHRPTQEILRTEPQKIYRSVTSLATDTSAAKKQIAGIDKNDTHSHPNYQKGVETVQTAASTKSASIPSVDPNTASGESDQQGSDLKTSQQNDEKLAKEETERKKAEIQAKIRRLNAESRERKNAFRNVLKRANRVKKDVEQRYYEVPVWLGNREETPIGVNLGIFANISRADSCRCHPYGA